MDFHYDKTTDSLYIELSGKPGVESEEVAQDIIVDYDESGRIVGLDIQHASGQVNLSNVHFSGFVPNVDVRPKPAV